MAGTDGRTGRLTLRIKEAFLVVLAMALAGVLLAMWRFGGASTRKADQLVLQLSWRAQAEAGGFYEALEKGYYRDCGVNLVIRQGGNGIASDQLLPTGAVDVAIIATSDGVLRMNQAGFKSRAIFAGLQHSPLGIDAHAESGITSVAGMRDSAVYISNSSRNTWWQFLKSRYGLSDAQLRSYTGQHAPFIADRQAVMQNAITNGGYVLQHEAGIKVRSFLLSDLGYDQYGGVLTAPQSLIDRHPAQVRCLVDASRRGWADYLKDPKVGFAAVARAAPENTPDLMAYSYRIMKERKLVENADTAAHGLGAMTDARWKSVFDVGVEAKLFPTDLDYRQGYTLAYQENGR
ncbi:ABC transporter substrate-binding protein [Sphingomonas sp. MMS24-J13]|uniref:ABC transporter substrate-binding protein n=1 Tax=Sphingomonas sp. MMS24-J13 TaxID=3238686 RepID=UPI0038502D42